MTDQKDRWGRWRPKLTPEETQVLISDWYRRGLFGGLVQEWDEGVEYRHNSFNFVYVATADGKWVQNSIPYWRRADDPTEEMYIDGKDGHKVKLFDVYAKVRFPADLDMELTSEFWPKDMISVEALYNSGKTVVIVDMDPNPRNYNKLLVVDWYGSFPTGMHVKVNVENNIWTGTIEEILLADDAFDLLAHSATPTHMLPIIASAD